MPLTFLTFHWIYVGGGGGGFRLSKRMMNEGSEYQLSPRIWGYGRQFVDMDPMVSALKWILQGQVS